MDVKKFGVIGVGRQMGSGIAQIAAASGLRVLMSDISEEATTKGIHAIEKKISK